MTLYRPGRRSTILIPYNEVRHLFLIMNDPCPEGMCLSLMITSIKAGRIHDSTCILDVGDHDFIRHPSFVLYRMAETLKASHVSARIITYARNVDI